jgi:hypothetical protein
VQKRRKTNKRDRIIKFKKFKREKPRMKKRGKKKDE